MIKGLDIMGAVTIKKEENGGVSLSFEEKTSANIDKRLNELNKILGSWFAVADALGLKPTINTVKLFQRWTRGPEMLSHQEMPDHNWKMLLMIIEGQKPIRDFISRN